MKEAIKCFFKGWLNCIVVICCVIVGIVCIASGWEMTLSFLKQTLTIHVLSLLILTCIILVKNFIGRLKNGKNV